MINKIIRNFLAKQVAGRSDDGIMITLKDPKKVEMLENIMADLLMRNGIDPRAITSEAQLKTLLNQIEAMTKQSTTSGIRNVESAKVFDLKGKRIKDTDNIMGGEEIKFDDDLPPPGSRGGPDDIAAPVQSSEESLKNMIEAQNKKGIAKIKQRQKMLDDAIEDASPGFANDIKVDADLVAENLAERMGLVYDDLPTKQRLDLYDKAYTALSKKRFQQRQSLEDFVDDAGGVDESDPRGIDDFIPDPEDMAKGGRVGLKGGADAATASFSKSAGSSRKGRTGSVNVGAGGATFNPGGKDEGPDDRGSDRQNAVQYLVTQGYTPKQIKRITEGPNVIDKIKESRFNNPVTRGILRTGAYLYNPSLAGIDFRKALQVKDLYDYTMNQINNPNMTQEDMTLGATELSTKGGLLNDPFMEKQVIERITQAENDYMRKTGNLPPEFMGDRIRMNMYKGAMQGFKGPGFAKGGIARIGLKDGMNRRTFLKLFTGLVSLPIIGKVLKPLKVGKTVTKVPIIKTDNVAGKPEWFDQLVNKVILEGDDVSKRFATKDREIVHMKKLDEDTTVRVTQDLDEGAVKVDYENPENVYGDPVQLRYKKPNPDEGDPRPSAEFDTAESGPVGRAFGPDDYEIEIDELGGTSISDLTSDVSKLKEYATGQKPTLKEIVQSKKRKDKAARISEGGEDEMQAVIDRQGEFIQFDDVYPEGDFATGGIARMLGE